MGINLTPEQEHFMLGKLQAGKYRSAEELLEVALRLLEAHERAEAEWTERVRGKIDAAIAASEHTPLSMVQILWPELVCSLRWPGNFQGRNRPRYGKKLSTAADSKISRGK
jgi:antitoxin ParD1/3/4